ncbi:Os04g0249700, partial [Oryza sativa Japonica Group]
RAPPVHPNLASTDQASRHRLVPQPPLPSSLLLLPSSILSVSSPSSSTASSLVSVAASSPLVSPNAKPRVQPKLPPKTKLTTITFSPHHKRDYQVTCTNTGCRPCVVSCPSNCPNMCLVACAYCLTFCPPRASRPRCLLSAPMPGTPQRRR